MALDLTNIEDVMKAIQTEHIELEARTTGTDGGEGEGEDSQDGEGNGDDQGEPQDGDGEGQGEGGEGDGEGDEGDESESDGDSDGDGDEEDGEGEPEPIEIQVDPGAPVYVVRIWTDEHIANDYPDLRYEVEAEYPGDAAQAAHAAAAEALGTEDIFGTAVYDPALQEERARKAAEEAKAKEKIHVGPRLDELNIPRPGDTITMEGLDNILRDTYGKGLKDQLQSTSKLEQLLKDTQ